MSEYKPSAAVEEVAEEARLKRVSMQELQDQYNRMSGGLLRRYVPPADNGERNRRSDAKVSDPVNQPAHYRAHPSGIECIQVTEHMGFNIGNAVKYLWRCDLKNDAIEDLKKAVWYINREIAKREAK
jgi:hypothetical protein